MPYLRFVTMHQSVTKPTTNQKLRAARLAMRLSQSEFATAIRHAGASLGEPNECTKRLVQKWESGEHSGIRPNYRRALQAVTRIPYEQLGFVSANSVPVAPLIESAAAGLARSPSLRGLPQSGIEGDRLRYALTRPVIADPEAIALIETHTTHLFDLERTRPARLLAPQAAAHLDDIAAMLAGARRSSLRRQLAATGGRSATLAGWLAFDCGDVQGAHRWWDNALAAAQAASDGPLLACTLTYLSYSAADRGDPATAWQLANTALSHAGPNPRAKAWMAARAAQEAATLGERHAAQVALELSLDLGAGLAAPDVMATVAEQPWTAGFDLASLYAMAASTHGRLGELRLAREAAAFALAAMSPPMSEQDLDRTGGGLVDLADVADLADRTDQMRQADSDDPNSSADPADPTVQAEQEGRSGPIKPRRQSKLTQGSHYTSLTGPTDMLSCVVPDQTQFQVKSRAVALAEVAYAAARVGELDLARAAGRAAADLAGRLEVSQARRRLRALAPLLAGRREN